MINDDYEVGEIVNLLEINHFAIIIGKRKSKTYDCYVYNVLNFKNGIVIKNIYPNLHFIKMD
jgi:hypothetical protein